MLNRSLCAGCLKQHTAASSSFGILIPRRLLSITLKRDVRGKLYKPMYEEKWQRLAHRPMDYKLRKEIYLAQKRRVPWEYPVGPDQKAPWTHSLWYDEHYRHWTKAYQNFPIQENFSIINKETRKSLFKSKTQRQFMYLLLDRFMHKKYVIKPFDHEFVGSNISYYYQYIAHTKYVHGLPYCIEMASVDEDLLQRFRERVSEVLLMTLNPAFDAELTESKRRHLMMQSVFSSIFQDLLSMVTPQSVELQDCVLGHENENSMFWFKGRGFRKWTLPDDFPVAFQSHDSTFRQVRSKHQLPEFSTWLGDFSTSGEIPSCDTTPHIWGMQHKLYRNTISPGYRMWAGDIQDNYQFALDDDRLSDLAPPLEADHTYGHTQLALLPCTRDWYKESMEHNDITWEIEEHLKGYGIMSGWTWNAAQATFHRFWMDNDIDRPFCTQTIATDGQWMSFFCYQLNTIAIDPDNVDDNPRRNLCYGKTSVKLYDAITPDGVVGLNDEALKLMIKFLLNGAKQQQVVVTDANEVNKYDQTLDVQETDPDKPELECQMPLHKAHLMKEKLALQELVEKKRLESRTWKQKMQDYIGMNQ